MSGKFRTGIVALFVVGALTMALTATAFAQEETPEETPKPFGWHGRGLGMTRGMGGEAGLEAIAGVLGLTTEEVTDRLWGGETLSDLADEAGVELADLQDAVNAAHEQAKRDAIEQAVEDGNLTREHADWLLEGIDQGYMGGHSFGGFGMRPGFGRRGGFGESGRSGGPGSSGGLRFSAPSTNGSDA